LKILLIHNDNINFSLIESNEFNNSFFFGVTKQALLRKGFSFDAHIHDELLKCFSDNIQYDLIVIPASLSLDNYIEFTGLRVAHHVRLTKEFNHQNVPLLIISEEEPSQIRKLTSLANIFFTSGVFHSKNQDTKLIFDEIKKLFQEGMCPIDQLQFEEFLNIIHVEPPPNFDFKHSVVNEYAIYSWSKMVGLTNSEIEIELMTRLYFKYLDAVNGSHSIRDEDQFGFKKINIDRPSKILLIDDEANKGWGSFYKTIAGDNVEVIVPEIDYTVDEGEILNRVKEEIHHYNPEVILLDLRLSENDLRKENGLTGVKILSDLEEDPNINKGTRIIITSASNKIWNYLDAGIRDSDFLAGIIIKGAEKNSGIHPVVKVITTTDGAIRSAIYLKKIYSIIQSVKIAISSDFPEYKEDVEDSLFVSFKMIRLGMSNRKYLNYAYSELFRIIEGFIKLDQVCQVSEGEILIKSTNKYLIAGVQQKSGSYLTSVGYQESGFIISNSEIKKRKSGEFDTDPLCRLVLFYGYGVAVDAQIMKDWSKVNRVRNTKAIHKSKLDKGAVDQKEIEGILNFLKFIVIKKNRCTGNEKYQVSISKKSNENRIQGILSENEALLALKNKMNKEK
jgi:CheY-like chemotaxis protein